jgi:hypothetical protein
VSFSTFFSFFHVVFALDGIQASRRLARGFRKRKETKENSRLQISFESFCLYLAGTTRIFEADFSHMNGLS